MRLTIVRLSPLLVLAMTLLSCTDGPASPSPVIRATRNMASLGARSVAIGGPKYLPYGVPIPVDSILDSYPRPFTFAEHGPPIVGSTKETNLLAKPGYHPPPPPGFFGQRRGPSISDFGGGQAFSIPIVPNPATQFFGIYQNNDVELGLVLPSTSGATRFLYSPTILPPGGTCVEATIIHRRDKGGTTKHQLGWYNWCYPPPPAPGQVGGM